MNIRDRVKELRVVSSEDVVPNPKNWREHPEEQRKAIEGVLEEVGYAAAALARELPDGRLMLIDGHLRHELAKGGRLPVLVLDVNEVEADKLLLTLDPMKEMADADAAAAQALFETIDTGSEALARLLGRTAEAAGLFGDSGALHDTEEPPYGDDGEDADAVLAGVRMVQLFLSETNITGFHHACATLGERYGTDNLTDTVLEAMRSAVNSL
jgi:hypothetical protein